MEKTGTASAARNRWSASWFPTGYSFNLDGTNIYMTLATLFIAQALGVDLNLRPATDHFWWWRC